MMSKIQSPPRLLALLGLLGLLGFGGCTGVNPATGESQFTAFMSPAEEARIGAREHPGILAQYGGVLSDPELGAYIAGIAGRLVANSELAHEPFRITILNSSAVNAFALPGGYVYITRGLLALANSEAEVAGVLAHEIGHVTARHAAQRYSRGALTNIGATLLGAVVGNSGIGDLASMGGKAYLASYSRSQELEADQLGVRYLERSGYDPFAEADFLAAMGRQSALEAKLTGRTGAAGGGFLATHPGTAERVHKAIARARGTGAAPHVRPRLRDKYLSLINGLAYGDEPEQGLIRGRVFAHPQLGFTFTVPDGFHLSNSAGMVVAKGPGDSYVVFGGARAEARHGMVKYLTEKWAAKVSLDGVQAMEVNGMEAATGHHAASGSAGGQSRGFDIRYVAIRFGPHQIYRFQFVTRPDRTAALDAALRATIQSFRRLGDGEAHALQPRHIEIIAVRRGDSLAGLARLMPEGVLRRERLAALNGLFPSQRLVPGSHLKIIVDSGRTASAR